MNINIPEILNKNIAIKARFIKTSNGEIPILFIPQLTDRHFLSEFVIEPIVRNKNIEITSEVLMKEMLTIDEMEIGTDFALIEEHILNGMTVVILDSDYVVVNIKKVERKNVGEPQISYTLRGPKDSLVENLEANLSLLRYRIKDEHMATENFKVGRRTKTSVAMFYLDDVANSKVVEEVRKRINDIDVDGILESGELQQFLTKGKFQIFPQLGIVERSDMAAGAILEGKIVILVDGSGIGLVAPKVFVEYFGSEDDHYDNKFFGAYSKRIRMFALFVMILLMPTYVATVTFKLQYFSPKYLELIYSLRQNVPFSPMIEALLAVFVIELLRESLLRVPNVVGGAIGIAAGVILGDAVVTAGILSTLTLIIATLTLLMSFTPPDFTIAHPFRIFHPILIILAGFFSFWGILGGVIILIIVLATHKSFGVPFLAPIIPFYPGDAAKSFYYSKTDCVQRPKFLNLKDKVRGKKGS